MRSYIFTNVERRRLKRFLAAGEKDKGTLNILSRIRVFEDLAGDVQLYRRVREAMEAL